MYPASMITTFQVPCSEKGVTAVNVPSECVPQQAGQKGKGVVVREPKMTRTASESKAKTRP